MTYRCQLPLGKSQVLNPSSRMSWIITPRLSILNTQTKNSATKGAGQGCHKRKVTRKRMRTNCLKAHLVWTRTTAQTENCDAGLAWRIWLHECHHETVNVILEHECRHETVNVTLEHVQLWGPIQALLEASKSCLLDTPVPLSLRHFQVSTDTLWHLVHSGEIS